MVKRRNQDFEEMQNSPGIGLLFSIRDFAPHWAYSGVETKVLIAGTFLGDKQHSSGLKWCCMFGKIEVSAEVLKDNVIQCQVPLHAPGPVPFYVTCGNRFACSEVCMFQYREKPSEVKSTAEDEVHFQMRLTNILHLGLERKGFDCSIVECDKCKLKNNIYSMISDKKIDSDVFIQNLMKVRLYEWLVCKVHEEGGKGLHILDNEGQGVIHLAAALGYEWAINVIVAASVSPNFRDARGRTALHWASYYGREEAVIALVRLGAAPGAVDDPRPTSPGSPGGQIAADLASSRGHKRIAAYLAEAYLTSHLNCLTVNENAMDSAAATIVAEKAIKIAIDEEQASYSKLGNDGSSASQQGEGYEKKIKEEDVD